MDERWAAAARRGREIHEKAVLFANEQGISYDEALQLVLKGR